MLIMKILKGKVEIMKKLIGILCVTLCICFSSVAILPAFSVFSVEEQLDMSDMLHQEGNQIFNGRGEAVRLLGTNVPHFGWTQAGPSMEAGEEMVDLALNEWQSNVIRLAVKPYYWNNGVFKLNAGEIVPGPDGKPQLVMSAEEYRKAVDRVVAKVAAQGKYVLLDNHSFYLPGEDSEIFWKNAAERYKNHPNVIFGLFNEPANCDWEQWKNGGHIKYEGQNDWGAEESIEIDSKGIQNLINIVRATGAKNLITVSGLTWGYDLTYVTTDYRLDDPMEDSNGMMYETHIYPERDPDYDTCFGIAAQEYPILVGECGPQIMGVFHENLKDEAAQAYMDKLVEYMDKYELHLTAWSLGSAPNLLGSGNKPTKYGEIIKEYIATNQAEKSVTLYEEKEYQGDSLSLNPGMYSIDAINAMGFDFSSLASLKSKDNFYQYAFTFMENMDGSGKVYTLANGIRDFSKIQLGFTPKALYVQRYIPQNILEDGAVITVSNANSANLENLIDGETTKWESTVESGWQTITIKLKEPYMLTGIALSHAGAAGELEVYNTSSYTISVSDNGSLYTRIAEVSNNTMSETSHKFDPMIVTYIKIVIKEGGMLDANRACLAEIMAYGLQYDGELGVLPDRIMINTGTTDNTDDNTQNNISDESDDIESVIVSGVEDEPLESEVISSDFMEPGVESNTSSESDTDESSSDITTGNQEESGNLPLVIGIISGAVVLAAVIAVVLIIVLKKHKKDTVKES